MLYHGNIDTEAMTDEELDELYRPLRTNSKKHNAPLYIYLILKENTDFNHRYTIREIQSVLEKDERYEVKIERKAVGRILQNLVEDDLGVWAERRKGFWYSEDGPDQAA